jgi:hypothetical protein
MHPSRHAKADKAIMVISKGGMVDVDIVDCTPVTLVGGNCCVTLFCVGVDVLGCCVVGVGLGDIVLGWLEGMLVVTMSVGVDVGAIPELFGSAMVSPLLPGP